MLALLLLSQLSVAAPASTGRTWTTRFLFARGEGTVYVIREPRRRNLPMPAGQTFHSFRVSRLGSVREFWLWNGEPFALDKKGRVWALDTSGSRQFLNKTILVLRGAFSALPYVLAIKIYFGGHWTVPDWTEWLTIDSREYIQELPEGIVLGLVASTAGLARLNRVLSFGLVNGANYFSELVATGVARVDQTEDHVWLTYSSGAAQTLDFRLMRESRRKICDEWLERMFEAP